MNPLGMIRAGARRLLAAWHSGLGRLAFRLGRPIGARRHFERVLDLDGDLFTAYVHLGLLAWQVGDLPGYQRELELARRIDPERYGRWRRPFEPFPLHHGRSAGEETGDRATWRSVRQGTPPRRGNAHAVELPGDGTDDVSPKLCEPFTGVDRSRGPQRRSGDDFLSPGERERFASLRPITRNEIAGIDLEDLTRQLGA